jgi:hypothetical protein
MRDVCAAVLGKVSGTFGWPLEPAAGNYDWNRAPPTILGKVLGW